MFTWRLQVRRRTRRDHFMDIAHHLKSSLYDCLDSSATLEYFNLTPYGYLESLPYGYFGIVTLWLLGYVPSHLIITWIHHSMILVYHLERHVICFFRLTNISGPSFISLAEVCHQFIFIMSDPTATGVPMKFLWFILYPIMLWRSLGKGSTAVTKTPKQWSYNLGCRQWC